jgi:hypothetical protein
MPSITVAFAIGRARYVGEGVGRCAPDAPGRRTYAVAPRSRAADDATRQGCGSVERHQSIHQGGDVTVVALAPIRRSAVLLTTDHSEALT